MRLGSVLFWAAYARMYDALWDGPLTDVLASRIICHLGTRPVVEVGAGTGLIAYRLRNAGCALSATEPNRFMRSRFKRRLPDVPISQEVIEELEPSNAEPSRTVVAINVVHLTINPEMAVGSLRRYAGADGRIVAVVPSQTASVWSIIRAQGRLDTRIWHILRFVVLQLMIAPLLPFAPRARRTAAVAALSAAAIRHETIEEVSELFVIPGQ